jgi:hypothetical protein
MSRILGWLGDLGESTIEVDQRIAQLHPRPEAVRYYTITLRNSEGGLPRVVAVTNTLPSGLTIDRNSIGGGANFDRQNGQLSWRGTIPPGGNHSINYQATPRSNLEAGTRIDNVVTIHDLNNDLRFEELASIWIEAPDLADSVMSLSPGNVLPGQPVTLTLELHNRSPVAGDISATVWLPFGLEPVTATLASEAGPITLQERRLTWQASLAPGGQASVSLALATPRLATITNYQAVALIDDGVANPLIRTAQLQLSPLTTYLPKFLQGATLTPQPANGR